ncbi:MAG: alpha/beta fold hydrolase [Bacteroidales bacterium]|nr:alpha/beta fold hydrolase [Bacteroidales bacterium]MBN2819396.1 alpha/beta fold hydrolase [Bacteroidales bacterium]
MNLFFEKIGNGPALVILHGLYGSGHNWLNIARILSDNFTVILVDQRNHGKSPHSALHNYDEMALDLKELTNLLQLERFYLLGHSMGGKTAITFTLQHPGQIEKLICVDISPYSYLDQKAFKPQIDFHRKILEGFANAPIQHLENRTVIENYFTEVTQDKHIAKFLLKNLKRNSKGKFAWQLNVEALRNNIDQVVDAAPPVKLGIQSFIPALFIRGGISPYITNEEMNAIPDVFPNAVFETFENSGHWLHAQETERFIQTVLNFLG